MPKRKPFLLLGLALFSGFWAFGSHHDPIILSEIQNVPAVVVHRGSATQRSLSNTISGLRETFRYFPDGEAEIDVRQTQDGHFVLLHDRNIRRETNGEGMVDEKTLAELLRHTRKDDFGNVTREEITLLEDVFALLRAYSNARLQIDAKLDSRESFFDIAAFISREIDINNRITISSGDGDVLCAMSHQFPNLHWGFDPGSSLTRDDIERVIRYGSACRVTALYIDFRVLARFGNRGAQDAVRKVQDGNFIVTVWAVDDFPRALQAAFWGVDKITTNRAEIMHHRLAHFWLEQQPP